MSRMNNRLSLIDSVMIINCVYFLIFLIFTFVCTVFDPFLFYSFAFVICD